MMNRKKCDLRWCIKCYVDVALTIILRRYIAIYNIKLLIELLSVVSNSLCRWVRGITCGIVNKKKES